MSAAEITVLGPGDTAVAGDLARPLAQVSSRSAALTAARGQHIASALMEELLRLAARKGLAFVDLTSRPSRAAANGLYQSLGFTLRATNCYRYDLNPKD